MNLTEQTVIERADDRWLWRAIDTETIVTSLDGAQKLFLNPVASIVWELADGRRTIADIVAAVCDRYDVSPEVALADILAWAEWLAARQMLSIADISAM
jgi:hypothetical protein